MFDKIRDVYKLQKQAKQIKAELANIHVEAEEEVAGAKVVVIVSGEMDVIKIHIPAEIVTSDHTERIAHALTKATNKAIKKAQEIAAEKMKAVMGDMQSMLGGGN